MQKKLSIILLIYMMGLFSCIPCPDIFPYWDINDFEIEFYTVDRDIIEDENFSGDSLIMELVLETEFLSQQINLQNPFINSAMALSCPQDGDEGLKDPLKAITFTSNQPFNKYDAGAPLNDLITSLDFETLEEFINISNGWWIGNNVEFTITQKPLNKAKHIFTLKMVFESGKEIEVQSKEIYWE